MAHKTKLIILRGNSGSGKTSVATLLRERSSGGRKIAIIEQDYVRRFILKEKERDNGDNIDLIRQTVTFALSRGYHVILEGILYSERYKPMLLELLEENDENYVYYLDVSLEGTLKRHKTKPNAHEFGEKEMREWHRPLDILGLRNERVIGEHSAQEATVAKILFETKL